jgi:subtilisin family serine protease
MPWALDSETNNSPIESEVINGEDGVCLLNDDSTIFLPSDDEIDETVHLNARVIVGFSSGYYSADAAWNGSPEASAARDLFMRYGNEIDELVTEQLWPYGMLVGYLPRYEDEVPTDLLTENQGIIDFVALDPPFSWFAQAQPPWQGDCPPLDWPWRRMQVYRCWRDNPQDGFSGRGIRVAVVDTGVHPHQELENRIVPGRSFIPNQEPTTDNIGHGTAMAGIIGGRRRERHGVAPDAIIVPVKVDHLGLDQRPQGGLSFAMAGLAWAASPNAHPDGGRAMIINISGGIEAPAYRERVQRDPLLFRRMNDIFVDVERRAIVTVAAGNRNSPDPSWPAVNGHVLAVGGTGPYDKRWVLRGIVGDRVDIVAGSNYGTAATGERHWIYVSAPAGGDEEPEAGPGRGPANAIDCIWPPGLGRPGGIQGTSPASAFAAGVIALVLEIEAVRGQPQPSLAQIRDHLVRTGREVTLPQIQRPGGAVQPDIGRRIDAFDATFTPLQ